MNITGMNPVTYNIPPLQPFRANFQTLPVSSEIQQTFCSFCFFSLCKSVFSRPFELCRNLTVGMRTE